MADLARRPVGDRGGSSVIDLRIDRTWEGEPVGEAEAVAVRLLPGAVRWAAEIEAPRHGDPAPDAPVGPTDRLWRHEVVELFVAEARPPDRDRWRYTEIEVGPHGHWLVLRFAGARREVDRPVAGISVSVRVDGRRWRARVEVPRRILPARPHLVNGFSLHGESAARRHLAATELPGTHPDFHRPDRFRIRA